MLRGSNPQDGYRPHKFDPEGHSRGKTLEKQPNPEAEVAGKSNQERNHKVDQINRALYDLCISVKDTAIDIFWGNQNEITKEDIESITTPEFTEAYHRASIEMISRIRYGQEFPYKHPQEMADESIPLDKFICDLGELYGKNIKMKLDEMSIGT